MGADGSLRLCAEGDSELDEPGRSLVEGAALVAGFREFLMGSMDVREGALEVLVDVGQILHRGLLRRVGSVNHKKPGPVRDCRRVLQGAPELERILAVRLWRPRAPAQAAPPESGRPTPTASLACSDPNQPGRR
jgi:hypothetical protein